MIIKCKMCGGDMEISADQLTGTCEYCGSTMTLPKVDDEQRAAAFNRGNHFRRIGEFDKALAVYEGIVRENEADAEAHWCCALCRFGIEYVKDPATGEYIPTCHRASFDSFLEDVDYQAALEHADVVAREQYRKDGEKIAQVQKGILSISQKEQPFDVFICYKESDERGNRTVDSTLAQEIYYQLTDQGRRVFFARITLEDKAGQEYEPYIFAALHSAKVMVVVGTKPEYLNAVWVKNEWSRYLALMKHDRKRLLIPCYRDMDPYDLPEQLSVLQSYDMSKIGFIQDLTRGIAKVLDADKRPEEREVKETVILQGEGNVNLAALLKRGWQSLEDEEWEKADGFFDQALNIDAECGEAFFGKELASEKKRNPKAFIDDISANEDLKPEMLILPSLGQKVIKMTAENWKEAVEEATRMRKDALKQGELPPILQTGEALEACLRDEKRIEAIVAKYEVPGYLTREEILKDFSEGNLRSYISAVSIRRLFQANGESRLVENKNLVRARRYAKGAFAQEFNEICGEIDRIFHQRMEEAEAQDAEIKKQIREKYEAFLEKAEKLIEEKSGKAQKMREAAYLAACEWQKKAAYSADSHSVAKYFEKLGAYKDCEDRTKECRKREEESRVEEKRILKEAELRDEQVRKQKKMAIIGAVVAVAIALFVNAKVIQPSLKYNKAQILMEEGKYLEAYAKFNQIRNYKDVSDLISNEEFSVEYYSKGDEVIFGSYEQDNKGDEAEDIEWIVLDKEDDRLLLLSKYILDAKPYDGREERELELVGTTWETCTIREWLNSDFLKEAFSDEEKALIYITEIDNSWDFYDVTGGKNTQDQIFLLSRSEASDYLKSITLRMCGPTAYAKSLGAYLDWWLRTPGMNQYRASSVSGDGELNDMMWANIDGGVRPALWISLESDIFKF